MTTTEKILAGRRMAGKSTAQGMMLLEHIYKGEKYLLFTAVNNTVHIIPDKKLKELIHQALAEERERVRGEIRNQEGASLPDLYSMSDDIISKSDLLSSLDKLTDK